MHPNHRYFKACHGEWHCELSMVVTDAAVLQRSGMGAMDRLSLRGISAWPRWLGPFLFETSVVYDSGGKVCHTTVVRYLGIALMRSVEWIALDCDGRSFTIEGEQRVFPTLWMRRAVSGTGTIDATGMRADYALTWLGVPMQQSTLRQGNLVTVNQYGPGFSGVQSLVRISTGCT